MPLAVVKQLFMFKCTVIRHHPGSSLKQLLQSDTVKPLFWPTSTLTSAVVYTVKVWKEWIEWRMKERMQPLPQSRSLNNHCSALSDCSVWQMVIISSNPRRVTQNCRDFKVGVVFLKKEGQINVWHAIHSLLPCSNFICLQYGLTLQAPIAV